MFDLTNAQLLSGTFTLIIAMAFVIYCQCR